MPKNAYEAMSLLDDNQDGWLTVSELISLAVWQDQNQNGISEPNELKPLKLTGIVGLRTTFTDQDGDSLVSNGGIKFADGRHLPTYDWITRAKLSTKN